jgi:hypothetical protein
MTKKHDHCYSGNKKQETGPTFIHDAPNKLAIFSCAVPAQSSRHIQQGWAHAVLRIQAVHLLKMQQAQREVTCTRQYQGQHQMSGQISHEIAQAATQIQEEGECLITAPARL